MDYTWIVSTPTSFSGKLLMSVGAVRHRFLVAVFVVAFCPCWWKFIVESCSQKRFNVHVIFQPVFLFVSHIGWFVDLEAERLVDGCVFTYVA